MISNKQTIIDQYLQLPWHYCTETSEWEGKKGYWVSVAELPDCSTFARTLEEGLALIPTLLKEYLRIAIQSKAEIPIPMQSEESTLAGKLLLRVPLSLHLGVKNAAKKERTSINQFAVKALTEAVTRASNPPYFRSLVQEEWQDTYNTSGTKVLGTIRGKAKMVTRKHKLSAKAKRKIG